EAEPRGARLLQGRAKLVDEAIVGLWKACEIPADLALVAVGGYGRGELYPCSDVDLLVLLPGAPDAGLCARLERLVGALWDIGLEIGHSVRTIDECVELAASDITIQTAMLESRRLAGAAPLFAEFVARLGAALDPRDFYKAKQLEQEQRYLRFHDTPYALEPNCKESPGGLR